MFNYDFSSFLFVNLIHVNQDVQHFIGFYSEIALSLSKYCSIKYLNVLSLIFQSFTISTYCSHTTCQKLNRFVCCSLVMLSVKFGRQS